MNIEQGEIYWVDLGDPADSEPGYRHPYLVVQNNLFNQSRIHTVVVCELTTNLRRAQAPGNVLLDAGEGNLSQPSVVNISQLFTVDKDHLQEYIGRLKPRRVQQVIQGIKLLLEPADVD